MVALALLGLFTVAVLILRRLGARAGVEPRMCCAARPWPPDDLGPPDGPAAP